MDVFQAIALAILQGLTEFLPISSSAHLILLPVILGWEDQGLAFDVAVHIGTLAAVVIYYRHDLRAITSAFLQSILGNSFNDEAKLAWYVLIGTIPVGLVGISLSHSTELFLRNPLLIAAATLVFAALLWWAEKKATEHKNKLNLKNAIIIGIFQAIALIPGTSRSGITITAGLLLGLKREYAAKFSFLLSIPVISLAGSLKGLELYQSNIDVLWHFMFIGSSVSAIVAYLSIRWFLTLLDKIGMMPFVWYRIALAVLLIGVFS